jgi:hypothetical protein
MRRIFLFFIFQAGTCAVQIDGVQFRGRHFRADCWVGVMCSLLVESVGGETVCVGSCMMRMNKKRERDEQETYPNVVTRSMAKRARTELVPWISKPVLPYELLNKIFMYAMETAMADENGMRKFDLRAVFLEIPAAHEAAFMFPVMSSIPFRLMQYPVMWESLARFSKGTQNIDLYCTTCVPSTLPCKMSLRTLSVLEKDKFLEVAKHVSDIGKLCVAGCEPFEVLDAVQAHGITVREIHLSGKPYGGLTPLDRGHVLFEGTTLTLVNYVLDNLSHLGTARPVEITLTDCLVTNSFTEWLRGIPKVTLCRCHGFTSLDFLAESQEVCLDRLEFVCLQTLDPLVQCAKVDIIGLLGLPSLTPLLAIQDRVTVFTYCDGRNERMCQWEVTQFRQMGQRLVPRDHGVLNDAAVVRYACYVHGVLRDYRQVRRSGDVREIAKYVLYFRHMIDLYGANTEIQRALQ